MRSRILLLALLALATAACKSRPETVSIPCDVSSIPRGATVEFRTQSQPARGLPPVHGDWTYLGITPYKGSMPVPRSTLKRKEDQVAVRVTAPDHHEALLEQPVSSLDPQAGIRFEARLRPIGHTLPP